jgi:hypothetical protein
MGVLCGGKEADVVHHWLNLGTGLLRLLDAVRRLFNFKTEKRQPVSGSVTIVLRNQGEITINIVPAPSAFGEKNRALILTESPL